MAETLVTGGYVRHRDRMVQESIMEDLTDVLIACRWMPGTTTHSVWDPYNSTPTWGQVTTAPEQVLNLLEDNPVVMIDYFPEAEGDQGRVGDSTTSKTAPNTLAIDGGTTGEAVQREMGGTGEFVPYTFNMAFFASSDAVAQALLNDVRDRYAGRLARDSNVDLWNYNSEDTKPVCRMSIESYSYRVNSDAVAPHEVHLYFGELLILDDVD
jgi:hypothetical protein